MRRVSDLSGRGVWNLTSFAGSCSGESSSSSSSPNVSVYGVTGSVSGRESLIKLNTFKMLASIVDNSTCFLSVVHSPVVRPFPKFGDSSP